MTTHPATSTVHSLTYEKAAALVEEATIDDVAAALKLVMAGMGRSMDAGRIKTVSLLILDQGWKRAEIMQAARHLASDPDLRDHIRYGGTITPADFAAVRKGEERRLRDEEGETRTVITLSGYALQVRQARLYTYDEARNLWQAMGEPGRFSDSRQRQYDDSRFSVVDVEGADGSISKTYWRLK